MMATEGEQNFNKDIQNLYKECVTPLLKALLLQRVKELKEPNQPDEKWTVNLFLHKNKRQLFPCLRNEHLEDVLYPYEEHTNLDNWDFTAYVIVLLNACKLNESLEEDLINLDELANKTLLCPNNKLSEGIYFAYQDHIRCCINQICKSLENGGNSQNILSRFEEICPPSSRCKYQIGSAQKSEKDGQFVSRRDCDAIAYLEWMEDKLKNIEENPLIPEIEVVVILKHYNKNDEQRVSKCIETAFMEAVKKYDVAVFTSQDRKALNTYQEEAAFFASEDVKEHIQFYVKRLFEGRQRVTSVTTGCVKLKIQCETVRAVIDLLEQSIDGLLTVNLVTLEDKIRLIHGHELFDVYVGVTRESCWKLVNDLKTVAFGGYRRGRLHEKLTISSKRIEDGQKIIIRSRPTTVTSVMDLRRIVSSDERMETCRELTELLTRELPSSEGTIKMSMNVLQDKSIYGPEFSEWKKDGTNPDETPTIKCVGEIELVDRHGKKEVGYIFAMAVVGDRFLVAVDLYKRPCLRCFDVDIGKQVGHCAFDTGARPTGLTTIPGNRVAVTLPYSVWFLRVTENGDLSSENQMKVNKIYQGIASCGDNLIVSYKHPDPGVRILDMKGNVLKEFEKDYDGGNLFEWPNCMAVGPDHSTIYITEKGNKSVTALTMEGHVRGVVVVKEIEPFPTYITVDSGGRVYVCGFDTVFLVSFESGTVIPLLDKRNGITNSRCVSVHDQTRHLYVGSWYSNVIMVFEMPKLATA